MLVERMTFRAKYGRGDELVALFKDPVMQAQMRQMPVGAMRIYTDVTGPMFLVQVEQEIAGFKEYADYQTGESALYATADFQAWFGKMMEICESGERQLFRVESL